MYDDQQYCPVCVGVMRTTGDCSHDCGYNSAASDLVTLTLEQAAPLHIEKLNKKITALNRSGNFEGIGELLFLRTALTYLTSETARTTLSGETT